MIVFQLNNTIHTKCGDVNWSYEVANRHFVVLLLLYVLAYSYSIEIVNKHIECRIPGNSNALKGKEVF